MERAAVHLVEFRRLVARKDRRRARGLAGRRLAARALHLPPGDDAEFIPAPDR
jgi:4'-phosphopantetheinyl transferase EntD